MAITKPPSTTTKSDTFSRVVQKSSKDAIGGNVDKAISSEILNAIHKERRIRIEI